MYLVREVFHTKPGKTKELVNKFKQVAPYFEKNGMRDVKIMTDIASKYWTMVMEYKVENPGDFLSELREVTSRPEVKSHMEGYMDLVEDGNREIFLIENS
ncbi:MAG: hypothetical protein EH225_08640 [Calditrichaeota bacterium]|nr:hypothetical protein [Calditrichota bacterium]RQW02307.1 MAG: hypothetical protein EH225_08640 [Calditrichota bacterium]